MNNKRIIISSFHTLISRNILQTPTIDGLLKNGFEVVIAVPNFKQRYFEKTFKRPGVNIIGFEVGAPIRTKRVGMLKRLAEALPPTRRALLGRKLTLSGETKSRLYYFLFYYPVHYLGKSKLAMKILRRLDYLISPRRRFYDLLDKYKPDLVFSTDVQNEHDVALMQDAYKKNIPIIGMVRSWDNVVTRAFRFTPKRLIVHNKIIADQCVSLYGLKRDAISVTGVPHYDKYFKAPALDKSKFLKYLGLDPARKSILYFPLCDYRVVRSKSSPVYLDKIVLETLSQLPFNVIVRFPPNETVTVPGFVKPANFYYDQPGVGFDSASITTREVSKDDDERLMHEIQAADLVVCGPSTALIDSAIFGKPIIAIDFEAGHESGLHGRIFEYESEHIENVMKTGGVSRAESVSDLKKLIEELIKDPKKGDRGREQIVMEQCYKTDGNSSSRVVAEILSYLS